MLQSTRTRIFIPLMMLGIVVSWVIANGSTRNIVQAQDPICVDRPDDQKATPPATVWVEVGWEYLNEWQEVLEVTEPFAREFSLDFYVAGVLIGEMGPNPAAGNVTLPANNNRWEDAALEAMSVAIRSFTWFRLNYAGQYGDPHEITLDNTNQCGFWDYKAENGQQINAQVFRPYSFDVSAEVRAYYHTIVARVADLYLVNQTGTYPIDAEYRATTGEYSLDVADRDYLESVYDPVSAIDVSGSAPGMGQWGTQRWALGLDQTGDAGVAYPQWEHFQQILLHYYTGVNLREVNNLQADGIQTPTYRWNPLQVDWHTANNSIPIMEHGTKYTVTFQIQNTGVYTWLGTGQFALIYHGWNTAGTLQRAPQAETYAVLNITEPVPPGAMVEDSITLYPPNPPEPGTAYQLRFEMGLWQAPPDDWIGFSEAETGYTWPTYAVTVCVGGPCQEQVFLPLVNREMGTTR